MIFTEINKKNKEITILVSALDWGLGHATRCIPIIKELQTLHFNIIIAASGSTENLLKKEFPHLLFLHCPKYDIRYSRKKYWLPAKLLYQVPKIVLTIIKEQFWLKKVVKKHHLGAIISDNRPGLYHSKVYSVYITHQLLIKTGNSFTEKIAQKIHYWFIKKYNACWIPDFEGKPNLAGDLSHSIRPLPNTRYLGCLSRFSKTSGIEKTIDLLLLISGPEPQRSIFETILISQAKRLDGNILVVRGLPGMDAREIDTTKEYGFSGEIQIQNHLPSDELNIALQQSKLVVCRSGYTSVMDFIKLQQKAILVPTPGQTEQEYLAAHLLEQKIFFTTSQHNFQLSKAIQQAEEFPYLFPCFDMEMFKTQLKQFAQSI